MNILITGSSGFIGRNLVKYFLQDESTHKLYTPKHSELDLLNKSSLINYIYNNEIDIIIHCAAKGGRRHTIDDISVFNDNMKMWDNISKCNCALIINFGSGAEFDRRHSIDSAKPVEIFYNLPIDYYGLSKNLIARSISNMNNAINLRLFGCFGADEPDDRFIKCCIKNPYLIIFEDKYFDFFYINDLYRVVKYYIDNFSYIKQFSKGNKDINCVYKDKYKLSEIARKIRGESKSILSYKNNNISNNYTGSNTQINKLNIVLLGLDNALLNTQRELI